MALHAGAALRRRQRAHPPPHKNLAPRHGSFRLRHRSPPRISCAIKEREPACQLPLSSSSRQAPPLPRRRRHSLLQWGIPVLETCPVQTPKYCKDPAHERLVAAASRSHPKPRRLLQDSVDRPARRACFHPPPLHPPPPASPDPLQPAMASTPAQRARMLLSINIAVLVVLGPYALLAPAGAAAHLFGDARAGKVASLLDMSPPSSGSPLFSYQMLGALLRWWCGSVQGCAARRISACIELACTPRLQLTCALLRRYLVGGGGRGLCTGPARSPQVQVPRCAVLCCAVLRCAAMGCVVLCFAVLDWARLFHAAQRLLSSAGTPPPAPAQLQHSLGAACAHSAPCCHTHSE